MAHWVNVLAAKRDNLSPSQEHMVRQKTNLIQVVLWPPVPKEIQVNKVIFFIMKNNGLVISSSACRDLGSYYLFLMARNCTVSTSACVYPRTGIPRHTLTSLQKGASSQSARVFWVSGIMSSWEVRRKNFSTNVLGSVWSAAFIQFSLIPFQQWRISIRN